MQFDLTCAKCLADRQAGVLAGETDGEKKLSCYREMLRAIADAPAGVAAPWLIPVFNEIYGRYFGSAEDPDAECKRESTRIMQTRVPALRERIRSAADQLYAALQTAAVGNYIDFGVLRGRVRYDELDALLETLPALDPAEYRNFRRDLSAARSLLYLTDNCGEILLDALVLEILKREYPALRLTVCVRGGPALNDALRADAEEAGIPAFAAVIDNGSRIPGTEPSCLGAAAKTALETADVIVSKGQANLETLHGCGKNVYYLFLCKCSRFTELFRVPPMTGMFVNERRIRQ